MSTYTYPPRLALPVSERDHIQGSLDAPVTLVEYGDYECPYCGMAYYVIKELQDRMGDRMAFVFRNFPLTIKHPNAMLAAEAAETAGAQGKFWEMHDTLYENQDNLQPENLIAYANAIGLNLDQFARDLEMHKYATRVEEDFRSGVRSGVNGTPTFFINDVRYDGEYDLESLLAAVVEAARTGIRA